jgi:hypothetical protein
MEKVVRNLNLNVVYRVQAKLRKVEIYAPAVPAHVVVDSLMKGFTMEMKLSENSASGVVKYAVAGEEREFKFTSEYDTGVLDEHLFRVVALIDRQRNCLVLSQGHRLNSICYFIGRAVASVCASDGGVVCRLAVVSRCVSLDRPNLDRFGTVPVVFLGGLSENYRIDIEFVCDFGSIFGC